MMEAGVLPGYFGGRMTGGLSLSRAGSWRVGDGVETERSRDPKETQLSSRIRNERVAHFEGGGRGEMREKMVQQSVLA